MNAARCELLAEARALVAILEEAAALAGRDTPAVAIRLRMAAEMIMRLSKQ